MVGLEILILLINPVRISHDGVSACKQDYFSRQEIYIHESIRMPILSLKLDLLIVRGFQINKP